jgi:hypothetical protein
MRGIRGNAFLIAAFIIFTFSFAAFAQTDPPDRVARLNLMEGAVSFLPSGGDDDDWVTATLNRPLTTGDRLWVDEKSRSELHIGSTAIRMNANTGISFLNLDSANVQIRLSNGSINVKLRSLDQDNAFEVDTPNLAFAIKRPGNYRIDANPDTNKTIITVWQGEGEVIGGGRSWQVISDQQAILTGVNPLDYDLRDPDDQPLGDFDKWAKSRDQREDRAVSGQYVSRQMTGYEDLDANGTWKQIPSYGYCWTPMRVAADWAPYRYGHWVSIEPWGWTWVADEPWGFAPFHYGRWMHHENAWFWVPGPIVVRPVYAPALVAWVGGSNFSFSVSIGRGGGIGWFPLGPREVFLPTYRVSERYVTHINVTNTVIVRETILNAYHNRSVQNVTYVNRVIPSAVTVVTRETFVNARPVARNIVRVQERELAAAPVSHQIDAVPERSSILGAGQRNAPRPPTRVINLPVVTRQAPPSEPNHFVKVQSAPPQQLTNRTLDKGAPTSRPIVRADRPPQPSGSQDTAPPQRLTNRIPDQGAPAGRPIVRADKPPQTPPSQATAPREIRPLAKPAPAVQLPTAKEQNDVATKQKAWEKSRQKKNENSNRSKEQKEDRDKPQRP